MHLHLAVFIYSFLKQKKNGNLSQRILMKNGIFQIVRLMGSMCKIFHQYIVAPIILIIRVTIVLYYWQFATLIMNLYYATSEQMVEYPTGV